MTAKTFTHLRRDAQVKARVYVLLAKEVVDAHVLLERVKEAQEQFDKAMADSALDAHSFRIVVSTNPYGTCCSALLPEQVRWSLDSQGFKDVTLHPVTVKTDPK